ncbi:unnamed protein product [Musa acuminata var. zebrina]
MARPPWVQRLLVKLCKKTGVFGVNQSSRVWSSSHSGMFLHTLSVLHREPEKNFKAHLSSSRVSVVRDDFVAFRKAPAIVAYSLKSLQRKMEFLVNETRCAQTFLHNRQ